MKFPVYIKLSHSYAHGCTSLILSMRFPTYLSYNLDPLKFEVDLMNTFGDMAIQSLRPPG